MVVLSALVPESALSQSSRWMEIYRGNTVSIAADTTTAVVSGAEVRVWTQWRWKTPQTGLGSKRKYVSETALSAYACDRRVFMDLRSAFYGLTGAVVYSTDDTTFARWQAPIPETLGEEVLNGVCRRQRVFNGEYAEAVRLYGDSLVMAMKLRDSVCAIPPGAGTRPCQAWRRWLAIPGTGTDAQFRAAAVAMRQIDSSYAIPSPVQPLPVDP